jgi:hypothetical protein
MELQGMHDGAYMELQGIHDSTHMESKACPPFEEDAYPQGHT